MSADRERVFLGVPTYNGELHHGSAQSAMVTATHKRDTIMSIGSSSALCMNFNAMLCVALSERKSQDFKWFALLHGDIAPITEYWLDKLIDEGEATGADFISAVVPIKDGRGITSTAFENPANPWVPYCRVTMRQLNHPQFPQTFDAVEGAKAMADLPDGLGVNVPTGSRLLINTGCMALRLDRPWSEKLHFYTRDQIVKLPDGRWQAQFQPEDWLMSTMIAGFGGHVVATKKIQVAHIGVHAYRSTDLWGQKTDGDCIVDAEAAKAVEPELAVA
jgi:hypothetical protein